jgi:hypothetical protein
MTLRAVTAKASKHNVHDSSNHQELQEAAASSLGFLARLAFLALRLTGGYTKRQRERGGGTRRLSRGAQALVASSGASEDRSSVAIIGWVDKDTL